jgi:sulfite reductase (NADPH) flavoprotein alpha-component
MAAGAAIYVCGSLEGMAEGVEAALREHLGEELLAELQRGGRYRRDVY